MGTPEPLWDWRRAAISGTVDQPAATPEPDREAALESFLHQERDKDLLRFSTAGSVDDGKSTLIGRLLYDSKGVYEDQLASIAQARSSQNAGGVDFALLTDGLRAEREQGITIDVAYRYFETPRRKFIIADTPGHEQYTRNMATGASTANLAIVLVDARNGVLPQSRRHAFIASLLGIPHILVAVNKMDLVDWSQEVFETIRQEFTRFAAPLALHDLVFIPISALLGDNVVSKSSHMPWYQGGSLLSHLETAPIAADRNLAEMRFPVQFVIRPDQNFRGYAGQVASGILTPGETVMVLPSGRTSRIKSISTYDGDLPCAFAPLSVTVCLEDELDISRGDMLADPACPPEVLRVVDARLVWMSHTPLDLKRDYLIKHTTQEVKARVRAIRYRFDVNTLGQEPASELRLNEIAAAVIETRKPLFVDPYRRNRVTGAFILIDPISNETVAAGMISPPRIRHAGRTAGGDVSAPVTAAERAERYGHSAAIVWMAAGWDAACRLERALFERGAITQVVEATAAGEHLAPIAAASLAAGLILIVAGAPASLPLQSGASEIAGPDRFVEFAGSQEEDACVEELERRGILTRGVE
jgi:sulfate adenylyltransferase large subunit